MSLVVSGRHVDDHPDGHRHGVSIQIFINLDKRFIRISWRESLHLYLLSFPRFWTLSSERFSLLFCSILNSVTLKTRQQLTIFRIVRREMMSLCGGYVRNWKRNAILWRVLLSENLFHNHMSFQGYVCTPHEC